MSLSLVPAPRCALGLLLCCALLGHTRPADAVEALDVSEVASGIFVHQGHHAEANASNRGDLANIGFIVGDRAVAVIDSGGSRTIGERLRAAVEAQTGLPVRYVITTHGHPDHYFGNAAFAGDHPIFVGHRRLASAIAARGPHYLANFARLIGQSFRAEPLPQPALLVERALVLDLGNRMLHLRAHPTAHTDNDLTVFDEKTKTLFAGDLVFMERIPVVDGSLLGWIGAHPALEAIAAARVVPGHGPAVADWPHALSAQRRYLERLAKDVRAIVKSGGTIMQATRTAALSERKNWMLFEHNHERNVTASFAELEWED